MTITVHNLDTEDEYVYVGISHAQAVRNAFAQFSKHDLNTADYEKRYPVSLVQSRVHGSKKVWSLGQFSTVEALSAAA